MLNELTSKILSLGQDEREELLKLIGAFDLHRYATAEIRIEDWNGNDKKFPRALIIYPDGTQECIDIIKCVKEDIRSLGHPAILLAIRRWEHIVRYKNILFREGGVQFSEYDFPSIAISHLKQVGKALVDGVVGRAFPVDFAPTILGILMKKGFSIDEPLRIAWNLLGEERIKRKTYGEGDFGRTVYKDRKPNEKIRKLKDEMIRELKSEPYPLNQSPLRLNVSSARKRKLEGALMDETTPPNIAYRPLSSGQKREVLDLFIPLTPRNKAIASAIDGEVFVVNAKGAKIWLKIEELLLMGKDKCEVKHTHISLKELITICGYSIPTHKKVSSRTKKLASLLGINEWVVDHSLSNETRQIVIPRRVAQPPSIPILNTTIVDLIIDFLKSEPGKSFLNQRRAFATFKSVFSSWLVGLKPSSAKTYRKTSRRKMAAGELPSNTGKVLFDGSSVPPDWLDWQFLFPQFLNEYYIQELGDWLSLPTPPSA